MKKLRLLVLPAILLLALLLTTPAMAAEEFVTEPEERPQQYAAYNKEEVASISKVDLDAFTELFLREVASCPETIDISSLKIPHTDENRNQLSSQIWYETPEAFHCYSIGYYYSSSYITKVWIGEYYEFADTAEEYTVCLDKMRAGGDYLLEGIRGNNDLTDVEKALLLHDRLAAWTSYDYDNYYAGTIPDWDYTAYGPLGTRAGVCQGYAMAYMYLLARVGIESDYCSSNQLNHGWNIVYIDNKPYHVDVTWDDTDGELGGVYHNDFLVSTQRLYDGGHVASDFTVTTPVDTTYENAFWRSSYSAFQLLDGKMYFYDRSSQKICVYHKGQVTDLFYVSNYQLCTRLATYNGWLLYNDMEKVYAYDLLTGETKQLFTRDNGSYYRGWVTGLECIGNTLRISITNVTSDYQYSDSIEEMTIDLPAASQLNGWVDGKYYENNKLVVKAWREDENGWFYLSASGTLTKEEWLNKGGRWCYVGANGYMVKNAWVYDEPGWCYLGSDGFMVVSAWVEDQGKTYYCDKDGYRVTGTVTIGSITYQFDADGVLVEGEVPAILKQPVDAYVNTGELVKFSVETQGKVKSYRWQYRKIYTWFDTSMTGYNTDTLTVSAQGSRNNYDYRCVITFEDGTVLYSQPANLQVNTFINIISAPNDQVVVLGYKGQFTVHAEGEGLKYQWEYQRPDGERWIETAMEGATKPTVYVESTTARDGYKYRCRITDAAGKIVYSNAAKMSVLSFKTHPVETFASVNDTVQFTVSTSVSSGFTYQWQYRRSATGTWTNTTLTGYNTATLSVPAKGKNNYRYRCVVTGSKNCKLESKEATLHAGADVRIKQQPASLTAKIGATAVFTVEATDVYAYQWYYRTKTGTIWKKTSMDGYDTNRLNVEVTAGRNGYNYKCQLKGLNGIIYETEPAVLTVK